VITEIKLSAALCLIVVRIVYNVVGAATADFVFLIMPPQ